MPAKTPPFSEIYQLVQSDIVKMELALIAALKNIGDLCVKEAVQNGNYKDHTGNLRRSIGYAVAKDGIVLHLSDANARGRNYAYSMAIKSKGITLIVVAGEKYAEHVEATGRNVITSSQLLAENIFPVIMKRLGFKVS